MRWACTAGLCAALASGCGDSGGGDDGPGGSSGEATADGGPSSGAPTTSTATGPGTQSTTAGPAGSTGGSSSGDSSSGGSGTVVWLQNDSWEPPDLLTWQAWPSPNDCWASSYDIDDALYPVDVVAAEVAVGGGSGTQTFEVGVWTVDGSHEPQQPIDTTMVDIDGDVGDLTVVDLSLLDVPAITDGSFALVMCHVDHMGAPSIATDIDGTVDAGNNWVFQDLMGQWASAPDFFGIDGDFIFRAGVESRG